MGISQHIHGTDNSRCLISLAMITGNIGRKGTGLHPLRGTKQCSRCFRRWPNPHGLSRLSTISDKKNVEFFEDYWQTKLDPNPGLTVVEIMESIYEEKLKDYM